MKKIMFLFLILYFKSFFGTIFFPLSIISTSNKKFKNISEKSPIEIFFSRWSCIKAEEKKVNINIAHANKYLPSPTESSAQETAMFKTEGSISFIIISRSFSLLNMIPLYLSSSIFHSLSSARCTRKLFLRFR